ncbi:MAG: tetratricopeptide repeat protein [Nitrospinae bacterium]|nr:tetratricopeptide repeat protein [Nitrospinota bacterium]
MFTSLPFIKKICRNAIFFGFLSLGIVVPYIPHMGNDFIYDDRIVILSQKKIEGMADLARIFSERHFPVLPYYRPITRASLLFQKTLHGDNPKYFHLANAVLLAATGLLVYALMRLEIFGIQKYPALLAALLFALHPVASSCVYPISSGRETLLPSAIIIFAVYSFLRRGTGWYALSMLGFAGAIFSKEQAIIVPAIFVLADLLKLSPGPSNRRPLGWLMRHSPLVFILAVYFLIRSRLFAGSEFSVIMQDPLLPLWSVFYTIQAFLVPTWEMVYEPALEVWFSTPKFILTSILAVLIFIWTARSRGPVWKFSLFWAAWFLLAMLPTANILWQETQFCERYAFLSGLAIAAILAKLASLSWGRPMARRFIAAIGTGLVVFCACATYNRGIYHKNDKVFFVQWLKTDPRKDIVHYNLGNIFLNEGNLESAKAHYARSIEISDRFAADSHNNSGVILNKQGRKEEAARHFQEALRVWPRHLNARLNLAELMVSLNQPVEAARHYLKALEINPGLPAACNFVGRVLMDSGKLDEAGEYIKEALRLLPGYPEAHLNMGMVLSAQGKTAESIREYEEALRLKKSWPEVENNLAWILATAKDKNLRDGKKAVLLAESANAALGGKNVEVLNTLAAAYAEAGRFEEALRAASTACELALGSGKENLAKDIKKRIELYKAGSAYQE